MRNYLLILTLLATACVTPAPEEVVIPVMDPYTRASTLGPGVTEVTCPAGFVGYTHPQAVNGDIIHLLGVEDGEDITYTMVPCEHEATDTDG